MFATSPPATLERTAIVERAFQLARSGACASISDLRRRLQAEGYSDVQPHLAGPSLVKQLRILCLDAPGRAA